MPRCMMNGVIYYPGTENVLEAEEDIEKARVALGMKVVEEPGLKIIYLDNGDFSAKYKTANRDMYTIRRAAVRDERAGKIVPRLIFVKQDRDYWPRSEEDPDVMIRRAAKQQAYEAEGKLLKPDHIQMFVPPIPEELVPDFKATDLETLKHVNWKCYFDPSLPGTKFILENMNESLQRSFARCLRDRDMREKFLSSSLAGSIPSLNQYFENDEYSDMDCH